MATMKEEHAASNHQVHDVDILCVAPLDRHALETPSSYHQATSSSTLSPVDQPRTIWTSEEDGILRIVLAESIKLQPIPWQRISQSLPWKPPHEVLERTSKWLEDYQREISAHISAASMAAEQRVASSRVDPTPSRMKTKKRIRWTEEEHKGFLRGVETCGWGNWKTIAEMFTPTRSVSQITSHAQKYQIHKSSSRPGKRRSIHDISLAAANHQP